MSLKAILETWGPVMVTPAVIILLSLVEIAPIKINPWSAIIGFLSKNLSMLLPMMTEKLDRGEHKFCVSMMN